MILICLIPEFVGHKAVPGHAPHGPQHGAILDPASLDLLPDHLLPFSGIVLRTATGSVDGREHLPGAETQGKEETDPKKM
jgi:hypothetical protein